MSPVSPKIASPSLGPSFGDYRLLWLPCVKACDRFYCGGRVVWQFVCLGGHRINGPPSAAGTGWTEAAMNVPTKPTIRIEILIARFMGSSPRSA